MRKKARTDAGSSSDAPVAEEDQTDDQPNADSEPPAWECDACNMVNSGFMPVCERCDKSYEPPAFEAPAIPEDIDRETREYFHAMRDVEVQGYIRDSTFMGKHELACEMVKFMGAMGMDRAVKLDVDVVRDKLLNQNGAPHTEFKRIRVKLTKELTQQQSTQGSSSSSAAPPLNLPVWNFETAATLFFYLMLHTDLDRSNSQPTSALPKIFMPDTAPDGLPMLGMPELRFAWWRAL